MYLSRSCLNYKSIHTFVRLYSLSRQTHYEVLKLRKNCTDKEIKDAFIQMSKEYHPDRNKDAKAQEKFVRIVEAYNVLSKPSSRAQYDNVRHISKNSTRSSHYSYVYRPSPYNVHNADYNFYYGSHKYKNSNDNKDDSEKDNSNKWYYGFSGVKKLPNIYIIGACLGIAIIGVILQVYIIRNMYIQQRAQAIEKSKKLAAELEMVRSAARDNGTELQTRILLDKIVSASNPTVTTASLGQALADEKKNDVDDILKEFGIGDSPERWYDANDEDVKEWVWDDLKFIYDSKIFEDDDTGY